MSANPDGVISDHAKVFKYILDELVSKIPAAKRRSLYKKHCKDVEKRSLVKQRMIRTKAKSRKREYAERPLKEDDFIKLHVFLRLLETKYAAFMTDCTLIEAGHILGITRERVRQIEYQAIMKIKNPKLLNFLNQNNKLETVMEYKEIAVQRKNNKRRKEQ